VGDRVIVHLKNDLPPPPPPGGPRLAFLPPPESNRTSIHWHGIELDNDSDGTAVTQAAIPPGQSYTYRFHVSRPGIFWYHPHMMAAGQVFAGMYGPIVVENPIEPSLKGTGKVLPTDDYTKTIVLSDIDFNASGDVGLSGPYGFQSVYDLIEMVCKPKPKDCDKTDRGTPLVRGPIVLVNGESPNAAAQTPKYTVPSGQKVRLRLINTAISRYFRLRVINNGNDTALYRVGGEGGLLNAVRIEGGYKDGPDGLWNWGFDRGEMVLAPADRADVIIRPTGNDGDIIQIVGEPLPGSPMANAPLPDRGFLMGAGLPDDYPILFFQISGTSTDTAISAGQVLLASTNEKIEDIKCRRGALQSPPGSLRAADTCVSSPITGTLLDPKMLGKPGMSNEVILLTGPPHIDGIDGGSLETNSGNVGAHLGVGSPGSARYARVGDGLELSVRNETGQNHPFHLHGFSIQPVRYEDKSGKPLYEFDYNEFIDTIDIYAGTTLVFRVRLDDRRKSSDGPISFAFPSGGATGRWLFHCHIFHHAAEGMMSELVLPPLLIVRPPEKESDYCRFCPPAPCPMCGVFLVKDGWITDYTVNARTGKISQVRLNKGQIQGYSSDGKGMDLPFKVTFARKQGTFGEDRELLKMLNESSRVKGLYLDGNVLKGVILAPTDITPDQLPEQAKGSTQRGQVLH
jgi:FtsP/CotA-like multicopper oxidase with cupredoxin domain